SVTVSVWGSEKHLPMSMNFRQSWTKIDFFTTNADFSTFIEKMKTSISAPDFRFVLVPKTYTPLAGIGVGEAFSVSPTALWTPDYQSSRGWMSGLAFTNANWVSWVGSLPVRVCTDRTHSNVTDADSIASWGSVNASLKA